MRDTNDQATLTVYYQGELPNDISDQNCVEKLKIGPALATHPGSVITSSSIKHRLNSKLDLTIIHTLTAQDSTQLTTIGKIVFLPIEQKPYNDLNSLTINLSTVADATDNRAAHRIIRTWFVGLQKKTAETQQIEATKARAAAEAQIKQAKQAAFNAIIGSAETAALVFMDTHQIMEHDGQLVWTKKRQILGFLSKIFSQTTVDMRNGFHQAVEQAAFTVIPSLERTNLGITNADLEGCIEIAKQQAIKNRLIMLKNVAEPQPPVSPSEKKVSSSVRATLPQAAPHTPPEEPSAVPPKATTPPQAPPRTPPEPSAVPPKATTPPQPQKTQLPLQLNEIFFANAEDKPSVALTKLFASTCFFKTHTMNINNKPGMLRVAQDGKRYFTVTLTEKNAGNPSKTSGFCEFNLVVVFSPEISALPGAGCMIYENAVDKTTAFEGWITRLINPMQPKAVEPPTWRSSTPTKTSETGEEMGPPLGDDRKDTEMTEMPGLHPSRISTIFSAFTTQDGTASGRKKPGAADGEPSDNEPPPPSPKP